MAVAPLTACENGDSTSANDSTEIIGGVVSDLINGSGMGGSAQSGAQNQSGIAPISEAQSGLDSGAQSGDQSGSGEAEVNAAVEESEWRAAFDKDAYKNCTVSFTTDDGEGDVINIVFKSDKDNEKFYMQMTEANNGESAVYEAACAKVGDKYYGYEKSPSNQNWRRIELTKQQYDATYDEVFEHYLILSAFVDNYDKFDYEEESGKYKGENITIDGATCSAAVEFNDKKIVGVTLTAVEGENVYNYSIAFAAYGTTTIDIPTDFDEQTNNPQE